MTGPARYAAILRQPHVTPLLLASMLARLPYGVYALAVILYLSEARDSYAIAGLVDGAFAIGAAVGVPGQGRLIDRFGQRRVLVPAALLDATATGGLIVLTESGAPTGALVVCGLLGGIAIPSVGGALRALWSSLLGGRADLTGAAFALDSVALEVLFTSGPLLAALVVAVASPIAALGLSAVCTVAGTLLFVAQAPSRGWRPDRGAARAGGALGALRSSGVRTLAFAAIPVGFGFGTVEISLPAFAEEHGKTELAGVLLATWSVGSVAGGLIYGARSWPGSLGAIYLVLSVLLPLGFLPALLAGSITTMAVLVITAGIFIAPQAAAANELIARVAPRGMVTEAYSWPVTATLIGFAPGTAIGGALVEGSGWEACFLAAAAFAALGAVVVWWYRGTLAGDA